MNNVEERLRDALSARAELVTLDPRAYGEVVARRRRRVALRWLRPVAAATATIAFVAIAAVVARMDPDTAPTAPPPARGIAIVGYRAVTFDTSDLAKAPLSTTAREDGNVYAVSAVGDGRTFYFASQYATKCKSVLYRLDSQTDRIIDVEGRYSRHGYVSSIAVAPNESYLAYTTYPSEKDKCAAGVTVHIRDLFTGFEQSWPVPGAQYAESVTISPDGRYVAFRMDGFRIGRIDSETGALVVANDVNVWNRSGHPDCTPDAVAYLPTGELAAAMHCTATTTQGRITKQLVGTYDITTGKAVRSLFKLPSAFAPRALRFDATGRHALIIGSARNGDGAWSNEGTIFRWDKGMKEAARQPDQEPSLGQPDW